jgi:two-component system, NarL family, nitrate/nitrite response regulator NarL
MTEAPRQPEVPAAADARVRLIILADVRLYREGMRDSLERRPQFEIVGVAAGVDAACHLIRETRADIVIVDMATRGSRDGIARIREAAPGIQVVGFGVEEVEGEIVACAEAGLAGYVPCDASIDDLVDCIESVSRGELRCTPRVAAALFRSLEARRAGPPAKADLTNREREVLDLIDGGLSNKEIAVQLHIEVSTVKNHVHHLLEKLHVTSRVQAVARLSPPPSSRDRRVAGTRLHND